MIYLRPIKLDNRSKCMYLKNSDSDSVVLCCVRVVQTEYVFMHLLSLHLHLSVSLSLSLSIGILLLPYAYLLSFF